MMSVILVLCLLLIIVDIRSRTVINSTDAYGRISSGQPPGKIHRRKAGRWSALGHWAKSLILEFFSAVKSEGRRSFACLLKDNTGRILLAALPNLGQGHFPNEVIAPIVTGLVILRHTEGANQTTVSLSQLKVQYRIARTNSPNF